MKSNFSFLGLFLVALLTSFPALSAVQASATVSDTNVILGDIFILTVSINDNDSDYQLDTKSLEEDFTVFRPSQSQSTEIINGSFSQKTQWQVRLQAKKIGTLTVPEFKIGDYLTDAIQIEVTKASQNAQTDSDVHNGVFMENSIDKDRVFVGQSFIFTTKLYISKNSNSLDLNAPYFEGSENSISEQDKNSQTVRNGIRYNTIIRQYKMTATKPGLFQIDSPLLTGSLRKIVANRVTSEQINVRGERLNINVQAIPDDYKGDWIVSDDLHLIEDNDLTTHSYKIGEPITRSIRLQIASIDKDKMPNISLNYPKSLRVYPDQDQLEEGQANGLKYGVRVIRHAIIAEKIGTLTLPEIRLNWFNSKTNQQETAILPEQSVTIIAADEQQTPPISNVKQIEKPSQATIVIDNSALIYWQIATALLIIVIIFMIFYHLSYRRLIRNSQKQDKIATTPLNEHYLSLQNSFNKKSATACYSALLHYAQWRYPNLKSLNQYAQNTSLNETQIQQLKDEVQYLQQCCSDPSIPWNSAKLSELIEKDESSNNRSQQYDPMNLNP